MRVFLLALLGLTACAPLNVSEVPQRRAPVDAVSALPPMKIFAPTRAEPTQRSNAELARDFLELSFQMESGRVLPALTRFEGPVTVRVTGSNVPDSLHRDLDALIVRLQNEANIDIYRDDTNADASVTIEAISRRALQRAVPQAACFVVPNASSWREFRRNRRSQKLSWSRLETRERVAIFLPVDVSPQEIRDCLHEELAQALGPLNDVYRLPDTVFNDDNFHTVLTGFDMLMLQVTYAPELRSGMTRAEVEARLPRILARLNPRGASRGVAAEIDTPRAWIDAVETALSPSKNRDRRRGAAREALSIAQEQGWTDNRLAFSLFVLARFSLAHESDVALNSYYQAGALYQDNPQTQLQAAHVGLHLAAFSLSAGEAQSAITIVDAHAPVVARAQNAVLLSTLLLIKAEALDFRGQRADARAVRLDALGWARYGFGSEEEVNARAREIATLAPREIGDSSI